MTRGLVVIALVLVACGDKREIAPADPLDTIHFAETPLDWTRPIAAHAHDLTQFAGAAACKPCHAEIYASYARHSMARTGMRPIGSADVAKIFDAATTVTHARSGFSYTPSRRGKDYVITEALLGKDGKVIDSWDDPITHVFSAGSYGLAFYTLRAAFA